MSRCNDVRQLDTCGNAIYSRAMELSKIVIGGMRFKDRASAKATIHAAIDAGFNYLDTSPCYCRTSEDENSEVWVGEAVRESGYRQRVMISTKCSPGDGGLGLGDFNPAGGFGVRTRDQLLQVFEQSMRRLGMSRVDYYHLWTTHTVEQFDAAMAPGGWYDGVKSAGSSWDHLGITTHAVSEQVIEFLKSGKFETVTIPLNVINTTRLKVADYCRDKGIAVIAMNPLAGGFLAANDELKELALRYLMTLDNVHLLIGFSSPEEVAYAKWIQATMPSWNLDAKGILDRVSKLINAAEPRCTACGYCQPCPQNINVGAALSYYNIYKYMGLNEAKEAFLKKQWEDGLRLDQCVGCGECEQRCPNRLPVRKIISDARQMMYGQTGK
jgi:uncharacterized protein